MIFSYRLSYLPRRSTFIRQFSEVAHLTNRQCILVDGPQANDFLQSLTTNQMKLLAVHRGLFTAFLNPKGRVLFDAFIYHSEENRYILDVHKDMYERAISHLKRYILRSKVTLDKLDTSVYQAWPTTKDPKNTAFDALQTKVTSQLDYLAIRDPRNEKMGFRYLINSLQNVELHGELVSEKLYNVNRISLGVPEGPADFVPDVSLPLECNVDLMAGVDFNKGCYLGQELTIRTHHTGVIRKRIYPFQALANDGEDFRFIAEPDLAESGSDILYEGKKVGKVGSVIGNIGLGLFRTEHLGKELYLENGTLIRPVPKN